MNQPKKALSNPRCISDINLAAYCLAREYRLADFKKGPRSEFIFQDVPEEVILSYYGGDDQISARKLLDALKNLKGILAGVR